MADRVEAMEKNIQNKTQTTVERFEISQAKVRTGRQTNEHESLILAQDERWRRA